MNRKAFCSLIQGFFLCLFLLMTLSLNNWASLEETTNQDYKISDTEEPGQPSEYITDNLTENILPQTYTPVVRSVSLELRSRFISFRSFVMCTFATGYLFRAVLFLPEKERYFACFQVSIFCPARFLRDLSIQHKKDGKQRFFAV